MTQEQATRRRCGECGRFLSTDTTDGTCTACEAENGTTATGTTPEHAATNGTANGAANGSVAIPIQAPISSAVPARTPSASLSTGATRPPRGVVIQRPSELHPEAHSLLALKAPEQLPQAVPPVRPPEPEAPLDQFDIRARLRSFQEETPEPLPRPAPEPVDWTLRIFVGVAIGVLVGIAIPFLLTR
jgi:hypothetical protein